MDPIVFSTIVSLLADFVSQRRAENDASLEEFKTWLADQRHTEIIKLLDSNTERTIGIKALLHQSHSEIISRLEQLKLDIPHPYHQSELASAQEIADVVETIILGSNNNFAGTSIDLEDLATRCAIYAIEGKKVVFQIELQKTVLETPPNDPLILPRHEKARLELATQLKTRLQLLTSPTVYEWWGYILGRKEDWQLVIQSLLFRAKLDFYGIVMGQKIDVWRTEKPLLNAAIYLNPQEIAEALQHLGFKSTSELRFGAYWRAATDLPFNLITQHVIPSIIVQLERHNVPAVGDVLNLATWHIGEG
jgi:hypothetical protein